MDITFHGGACCGVKHIKNLGFSPSTTIGVCYGEGRWKDEDYEEEGPYDPTADGDSFESCDSFFADKRPEETYEQRLRAYVDYIAKWQPGCVVEVVITRSGHYNQDAWKPVLKDIGFRSVTGPFKNSNSGVLLEIFHLVIQDGEAQKPVKE